MTKRDEIIVHQLKATDEEMKVAMARVRKNSKSWVIWKDPVNRKKELLPKNNILPTECDEFLKMKTPRLDEDYLRSLKPQPDKDLE